MSLLLDALKKAEQAKHGSASPPLELASIENARPAVRPAIVGIAPGPSLGSAAHRAEQESARAVFAAKVAPAQNRALWLLLGGLSLLAIAAGVFWLWYSLAYPTQQPAPIAAGRANRPPVQLMASRPPANEPPAIEPAASAVMQPATTRPAAASLPSSSQTQSTKPPTAKSPPAVQGTQLKRSATDSATVNPELTAAYSALTRGDYPLATQQYQLVVRSDPFNIDAYLGLATAAASTGEAQAAQAYYRKALEIDPKNAVARAGLVAVQSDQNASLSERELRAQVAASPAAAAPYSALGHVYSGQSRWGDAQQVFFEAYRLDPADPDHAFNLAVSLDHLGQHTLARDYYVKALKLATARPAGFNAADANARLDRLGR